jgi:putative Mn2+ efflux pump MntP
MTQISQAQQPIVPSKKFVHSTFWIAHIGLVVGLALIPPKGTDSPLGLLGLVLLILGVISLFGYFFAIANYARRMGRSAVIWGGLTFITSPIGVWISYFMSFGLEQKPASQ